MRRIAPALVLVGVGLALVGCSDDDSDGTDSTADGGSGTESAAAFCADAEVAVATDASTPEDQLEALEAFAENAPDEIADDFDIVVEGFRSSIENQSSLDTPEMQAARSNIEDYVAAECGVDLTPTPTPGG
jgi:hypothetical protein